MNHGTIKTRLGLSSALFAFSSFIAAQPDNSSDVDLLPEFLINEEEKTTDHNSQESQGSSRSQNTSSSSHLFWIDQTITYTDWNDQDDLILSLSDEDNRYWSGLTRLNGRGNYSLTPSTEIKYDSLLNIIYDGNGLQSSEDLRLDLEELYFSWNAYQNTYLDLGRINVRNGVASGFNPTDYFRINSVVTRTTEDVSQLRDNRLGTLAFRAQQVWDGSALNFVASPDIGTKTDRWYTDKDIYGLNLNNTNSFPRYMLSYTHELTDGLSPELFFMNESGRNNFGLNISYTLNDRTILLLELNTGKRLSLIEEALYNTEEDVLVHPVLISAFPSTSDKFYTQSVIGVSYTNDQRITTNFEYHYNQAGLDEEDWKLYFDTAESYRGDEAIIGPLLSVKRLARNRLEPLSKHTIMIRTAWTDFIPDLSANMLIYYDLVDDSNMTQLELLWNYNQHLTLTARVSGFIGDDRSNFGSMDQKISSFLQLEYYF
jgi:hypothetical protein